MKSSANELFGPNAEQYNPLPIPNFLPRTPGKRFALAVLSLCLLIISAPFAVLLVISIFVPPQKGAMPDPWMRVFMTVFMETFFGVFVVSLLGLIWALWTPAWVERFIGKIALHVNVSLLVFMIVFAILALL